MEGKTLKNTLVDQILSEVYLFFVELVGVVLDQVEQSHYHLCLRAMHFPSVTAANEMRFIMAEVRVDPYSDLACLVDEDHLLNNVEVSHLFVENFEPLKSSSDHIELVRQGNIVDLFEPDIDLPGVEIPLIGSRAEVNHRYVEEILDGIDERRKIVIAVSARFGLYTHVGGFLPQCQLLDILHVVRLRHEFDVVLFDLLICLNVAQGSVSIIIDVVETHLAIG
jgi:hypothetical protein